MTDNYDEIELAKFDAVAMHWWDTQGPLRTLHEINPLRMDYISKKCQLAHKKVIDIGCGGGILTESMAKLGAEVTGIDLNKSVIEVAKLHQLTSHLQIEYQCIAAEALAEIRPHHYDVVTCLEMLEHVPDPLSIIRACANLVKPGGQLFFSTLNRTAKSYLFAIIGAEYILKLLPKNTHDYAKFIKPSELGSWFREADISLKELKGISYQPFTKKFSLSNDISVNYLIHASSVLSI